MQYINSHYHYLNVVNVVYVTASVDILDCGTFDVRETRLKVSIEE